MRLPLTEQQQRHLRNVRETQLAEWRASPFIVDEIFVEKEVVRLMASMGRACYLGLDGQVWVGNLGRENYRRLSMIPRAWHPVSLGGLVPLACPSWWRPCRRCPRAARCVRSARAPAKCRRKLSRVPQTASVTTAKGVKASGGHQFETTSASRRVCLRQISLRLTAWLIRSPRGGNDVITPARLRCVCYLCLMSACWNLGSRNAMAAPQRAGGLSVHMLPSGSPTFPRRRLASRFRNRAAASRSRATPTIETAQALVDYFKKLSPEIQQNGIWVVTTHPGAYSGKEIKNLDRLKEICTKEKIPLFTCRGSELPDGWKRQDR